MTRKWVVIGLLALGLMAAPGVAQAQFTCPIGIGSAATQIDIVTIVQDGLANPLLTDTVVGIWPGSLDGYADFDDMADYTDEVPVYAYQQLVNNIISNTAYDSIQGSTETLYSDVCASIANAANQLPPELICDALVGFFEGATDGGVAKSTSLSVAWLETASEIDDLLLVGYGSDDVSCPGVPAGTEFTPLGGAGNLLGDLGDSDQDGDDNLTEWQAAVAANPADFDAAVAEFITTALAGTAITVGVTGPSQLFKGFGSTYTAVTIDPTDPMFTEAHTFSSSNSSILQHLGGGVFMGVAAGTANVVATGNTSSATGTRAVTVVNPRWHEICGIDNTLLTEGGGLANSLGCLLTGGLTNDFFAPEYDLDGLLAAATPAPDSFQTALLAYTLCGNDASGLGPDTTAAAAEHAANVAAIDTFNMEAAAFQTWIAPTTAEVSRSATTTSLTVGGGNATLTASTENQDEMDVTGTYTFTRSNANVTINGGASASGVAGATGVTIAPVSEGSTVITITDETFGATGNITFNVDNLATNNTSIAGPDELNIGAMATYTAATVGPDSAETFTYSVAGGDASINPTSGLLSTGTIVAGLTVTATGSVTGVHNKAVTLFPGTPCDSAKVLGDANDPSPTSGPIIDILTLAALWDGPLTGGGGGGSYGEIVACGLCGGAGTANALDAGLAAIVGLGPLVLGGTHEVLNQFSALADVANIVSANLGINSESEAVTQGVLGAGSIFAAAPFNLPGTNLYNIGTPGHAIGDMAGGWTSVAGTLASLLPAAPGPTTTALHGMMVGSTFNLASVPAINLPNGNVVGSGFTKFGGFEPYSGESVFAPGATPSPITNQAAADAVVNSGGDHFDFVDIVTGDNLLATGSPFLPVGGALVVGLLVGGLAFAGARRVRRG